MLETKVAYLKTLLAMKEKLFKVCAELSACNSKNSSETIDTWKAACNAHEIMAIIDSLIAGFIIENPDCQLITATESVLIYGGEKKEIPSNVASLPNVSKVILHGYVAPEGLLGLSFSEAKVIASSKAPEVSSEIKDSARISNFGSIEVRAASDASRLEWDLKNRVLVYEIKKGDVLGVAITIRKFDDDNSMTLKHVPTQG